MANPSKVANHLHDHTLASLINGEPSNLDAVPSLDCLHKRRLSDDLDQLLAVVPLLEQLPDVARGNLLVKRDIDSVVDSSVNDVKKTPTS